MKTQFYILGLLLRYGAQHGYLLKQTVEEQISDFARLKLPNIYYTLDRLEENGYVTATVEKDGSRPERKVYAISKEGQAYFYVLLRKLMAEDYSPELPFDGVIFFGNMTDKNELRAAVTAAREKLERKLDSVIAHRDRVIGIIPDAGRAGTDAIFSHHIHHLKAEIEWLKEIEEGF